MPYKPNWNQERIKQENREIILELLDEQARTFTQLQKSTGFSPMGLTKMLKDLVKDGKIEKRDPKNKKSPYKIKGSGTRAKELLFPGRKINEIRDSGKFYIDLSENLTSELSNYGPLFGITSYLMFDKDIKKQYRPFWRQDMFDFERYVYENFYEKYTHGNIPILKERERKIYLIFELDYKDMINLVQTRDKDENDRLVKNKIKELELNP